LGDGAWTLTTREKKIMNTMMLGKPILGLAVLGAALVGCGASDGGSAGTATPGKPLSAAERFIANNAKTNSAMNMVALKYYNNGTEVAMFYEPSPGTVMVALAGSPVGSSMLNRAMVEGKTASEMWDVVAPGESVPEALARAIERSKNPAQAVERSTNPVAANDAIMAEYARLGSGEVSAPAPAAPTTVPTQGEKLYSGGYCSNGGFIHDWGNIGAGAAFRHQVDSTWGWIQDGAWNNWNFTGHEVFAACPMGDVSNTGGRVSVTTPHNLQFLTWDLPPDNFVVSPWILPPTQNGSGVFNDGDFNCGWDLCCGHGLQFGGTRCTPTGSIGNGRFDSTCMLNQGSSCGDHFWWIAYATLNGPSYCQDGQASCPCNAPNDCTGA
jgi:hypothetical protein